MIRDQAYELLREVAPVGHDNLIKRIEAHSVILRHGALGVGSEARQACIAECLSDLCALIIHEDKS